MNQPQNLVSAPAGQSFTWPIDPKDALDTAKKVIEKALQAIANGNLASDVIERIKSIIKRFKKPVNKLEADIEAGDIFAAEADAFVVAAEGAEAAAELAAMSIIVL